MGGASLAVMIAASAWRRPSGDPALAAGGGESSSRSSRRHRQGSVSNPSSSSDWLLGRLSSRGGCGVSCRRMGWAPRSCARAAPHARRAQYARELQLSMMPEAAPPLAWLTSPRSAFMRRVAALLRLLVGREQRRDRSATSRPRHGSGSCSRPAQRLTCSANPQVPPQCCAASDLAPDQPPRNAVRLRAAPRQAKSTATIASAGQPPVPPSQRRPVETIDSTRLPRAATTTSPNAL